MRGGWLTDKAFAHRGLHGPHTGAVENSMSAFNAAIQNGYGFELDVLLGKDQKAMVFHDKELSRLTHNHGNIIDFSSEALTNIQLKNSTDKIPTLNTVLEHCSNDAHILIEIKGDQEKFKEISDAVWNDIKDRHNHIAIMSFYPEIVDHFKKKHPQILRGLVATSRNDASLPAEFFDIENQLKTIKKLEIDFMAYDIKALPNEATEYCKNNFIPLLTWTVRSHEDRQQAKTHADNIIFEL